MFCTNCGKQNPEGGKFCWNCGQKIYTPTNPVQEDPQLRQAALEAEQRRIAQIQEKNRQAKQQREEKLRQAAQQQEQFKQYLCSRWDSFVKSPLVLVLAVATTAIALVNGIPSVEAGLQLITESGHFLVVIMGMVMLMNVIASALISIGTWIVICSARSLGYHGRTGSGLKMLQSGLTIQAGILTASAAILIWCIVELFMQLPVSLDDILLSEFGLQLLGFFGYMFLMIGFYYCMVRVTKQTEYMAMEFRPNADRLEHVVWMPAVIAAGNVICLFALENSIGQSFGVFSYMFADSLNGVTFSFVVSTSMYAICAVIMYQYRGMMRDVEYAYGFSRNAEALTNALSTRNGEYSSSAGQSSGPDGRMPSWKVAEMNAQNQHQPK